MMLWRLHLNTEPKDRAVCDVATYCLANNIAGIGWKVTSKPADIQTYEKMARQEHGRKCAAINFAYEPQIDSLIWIRDKAGCYWLGRVKSDWYYSDEEEHISLDIPNQRQCHWVKIGTEDKIPGRIVNGFRGTRAFQRVRNSEMEQFSRWIYNKECQTEHFQNISIPSITQDASTFFKFIHALDCEDIVGIYLQKELDYYLIPSTCKKSTTGYEFIMKHRLTGKTAAAQVKQDYYTIGNKLAENSDHVFLFSAGGTQDVSDKNITVLNAETLFNFVLKNQVFLPPKILYWLQLANKETIN